MFRHFIHCLEKGVETVIGLLCLGLIGALFIEVLNRYVFFTAWRALQYVIPFCIMWLVMLGSALAVRRSQHFEVDFLRKKLTGIPATLHRWALAVAIIAAGLVLAWTSIRFAQMGLIKRNPATGFQMIYIYASFPVGGALMALMAFSRLVSPPVRGDVMEESL